MEKDIENTLRDLGFQENTAFGTLSYWNLYVCEEFELEYRYNNISIHFYYGNYLFRICTINTPDHLRRVVESIREGNK